MRSLIYNSLLLAGSSLASPVSAHDLSTPTVLVKNGTYSGIYNANYNQDFFLGIPYAQPPINDLRFRIPQSLNSSWSDTKPATAYSPYCIGYGGDNIGHIMSEDCLYLSIIRPAGLSTQTLLPVALWIHGGGLVMGGSSDPRYNLSHIVANSVSMKAPMLAISIQYRLSAFGFLGGKEALAGGATNLGFRDQRLALLWVKENIAAFGGDPGSVTIWGESAGGQSVGAQLLAFNGRDDGLFRAGIAQSGGPANLFLARDGGYNSTGPQTAYNTLVSNTSCSSTIHTSESLKCLRALPFSELNAALNISTRGLQPFLPMIDGDFVATYPSIQLSRGDFVHVPLLIGANTDEGTSFGAGYPTVNADTEFLSVLNSTNLIRPDSTHASVIQALYPNIQALGIPSLSTYPSLITPSSPLANTSGLQARRIFAYFGDTVVIGPRRASNLAWSKFNVPSYAYRFDVTVNGVSPSVGATHFQEVAFVFNNTRGDGYAVNPFANTTRAFEKLAIQMSRSWVGFITALDPNANGIRGTGTWPVYNATRGGGAGDDFVFTINGSSFAEPDTWRGEGIAWIGENALEVYGR